MKTIVVLSQKLDNAAVPILCDALDHCLDGDIWLDGSAVDQIGGRCMELLISASCTARQGGHDLCFGALSGPLEDDLKIMGLNSTQIEVRGDT